MRSNGDLFALLEASASNLLDDFQMFLDTLSSSWCCLSAIDGSCTHSSPGTVNAPIGVSLEPFKND
jgi:hypothetical protein